jgi:hypothetical protein
MKLTPNQLSRIVEVKRDYLLISETIFRAKEMREKEGLSWEKAISKYLDSVPVELQMKFMDFFGASTQSTTANAVAKVLDMGIDNGVRDEEGNLVFTMDNNRIVMMLQALANADMEWKINETIGREMNRKKETPSGSLVYDPSGPAITKEQYIGRMPSDMLKIIKSMDEDEAKADAYQKIFDRMSENQPE